MPHEFWLPEDVFPHIEGEIPEAITEVGINHTRDPKTLLFLNKPYTRGLWAQRFFFFAARRFVLFVVLTAFIQSCVY